VIFKKKRKPLKVRIGYEGLSTWRQIPQDGYCHLLYLNTDSGEAEVIVEAGRDKIDVQICFHQADSPSPTVTPEDISELHALFEELNS